MLGHLFFFIPALTANVLYYQRKITQLNYKKYMTNEMTLEQAK